MAGPAPVNVRLAVVLTIGFPAAAFATNCYVLAPGAGQECLVVDPGIGVERAARARCCASTASSPPASC